MDIGQAADIFAHYIKILAQKVDPEMLKDGDVRGELQAAVEAFKKAIIYLT
jgi:hypothetical protein